MIRVTDQYFWNFVFGLFFVILVTMGTIVLETEARMSYKELSVTDFALITLATWRLVRLFSYDTTTKWFREQFYDVKKAGKGYVLEKPAYGPRRTMADFLSSPWCTSVWFAALVVFCYLLTPYAYYVTIFLSISAIASFLQLTSNLVTAQTEKIEGEME
jgi:Protein of unknown function (DUF1360)